MKQCKKCNSTSLTYVTDYEHLDFESEDYIKDNGWLCDTCEAFHYENGDYEFFVNDTVLTPYNPDYKQIMN
jgi:hypothetical protein